MWAAPQVDDPEETNPFSAFPFSKALGEEALLDLQDYFEEHPDSAPELCILRATSVQGRGRRTTELFAMASSLGIRAGAGTGKSPVSSVHALAEFVVMLGTFPGELPTIVLQPGKAQPSPPHPWMLVAATRTACPSGSASQPSRQATPFPS